MEHDFLYCPKCTRYAVFHWVGGRSQWECEDCAFRLPTDEVPAWTTTATLPS